jgi:FKBP-type peptidyl-prolyl cis-trans isomerase
METTQNKKITYIVVLIAILVFGYLIYAVIQSNKNKNMETNATTTDQLTNNEPRIAQAEDVIVINYSGKLANGTEFDSSYKRGQPFVFQIGIGQVIAGWDEGLIGVKKGDKKTLTITPDKGYGAEDVKGQDGKVIIPKNSTLIFDVEVVEVISKEDAEKMIAQQKAMVEAEGTTTAQ